MAAGVAVATAARLAVSLTSAHFLSGSAAGRYLTVLAAVVVTGAVLRLGLDQNAVRLIARDREAGVAPRTVIRSSVLLVTLTSAALVVAGLAGGVRAVLDDVLHLGISGPEVSLLIAWTISESSRLLFSEALRGFGNVGSATAFGDAGRYAALAIACLVLGLAHRATLEHYLAASCYTGIAAAAIAAARLARVAGRERPGAREHALVGVLAGTAPIFVTTLCAFVISQGDTIVVGGTLAHLTAAVYANASRISLCLVLPLAAVNLATSRTLARQLGSPDQTDLENRVRLVVTAAAAAALLGYLVLLGLGQPAVDAVLPGRYHEVAPLAMILALGPVVTTATGPNGLSLIMGAHASAAAWTVGVLSTIQLALMIAAALTLGVFGVAAVSSAGTIAQNIVLSVLARRRLGIRTETYLRPRDVLAGLHALRG